MHDRLKETGQPASPLSMQVTSIRTGPDGTWTIHYTPKKGHAAGKEQTLGGLDTLILADTLLAEKGAACAPCRLKRAGCWAAPDEPQAGAPSCD